MEKNKVPLSICLAAAIAGCRVGHDASAAGMAYPLASCAAGSSVVYVADRDLPGIWKIERGKMSVFFAGQKRFRTPLNAIRTLALDRDGRLLVGDSGTREVYRLDQSGKSTALTGARVGIPTGIAVSQAGDLLVADLEAHTVWKIPAAGGDPAKFATVRSPRALAIDKEDRLWVVSHGQDQLLRFATDGTAEVVVKGRPFQFPSAVAIDADGNAYVCDSYAKTIWKVEPTGEPQKWTAGAPLVYPVGLAWRGAALLVTDPQAKRLFEVDPAGRVNAVLQVTRAARD
jgi:DNA-binding beta-propeller fold protein YncE